MYRCKLKLYVHTLLVLLLCAFFVSCKSDKAKTDAGQTFNQVNIFGNSLGEPIVESASASFANYISEYSGGLQSRVTPVTIKLTIPIDFKQLPKKVSDNLFSFEPKIKGEVKWLDNYTVQYIPETGIFNFGQQFKVNFKLSELFVNAKGLGDFSFVQYTYPTDWVANLESIDTMGDAQLSYTYKLGLSDSISIDNLDALISAGHEGKQLPFTTTSIGHNEFLLEVAGVDKKSSKTTLEVKLSGKALGLKDIELKETIPTANEYMLLLAKRSESQSSRITLYFSKPVNNSFSSSYATIYNEDKSLKFKYVPDTGNGNKYTLYLKEDVPESLICSLGTTIYSADATLINNPGDFPMTYKLAKVMPSVKFNSNGTILPDSKKQQVLFTASSLKYIDLQVVKVYAANMKNFLQVNDYKGSTNLKLVGRSVFKQTIALEELASKPLNEKQEFALDMNKLFVQEPGSMYYLALSFKPSYTTIDKFADPELDLKMKKVSSIDDSKWDIPNTYGYDLFSFGIPYNWREYEWSERNNPFNSTFYMEDSNVSATTNIYSTRLGVNVKSNSDNRLWVTVNDIITTKPVGRAIITAYNFQLIKIGEATSDADGFAMLDCKNNTPFLITAQNGQDITYVKVVQGQQLSTSRFAVNGSTKANGIQGFIYGERGVWRPGDTIHVGFVVEDLENRLPKDHPAIFELFTPRGAFYTKQIASSVGNGMYYFKVATQKDDPTGIWNAYVKLGNSSFHKALNVETIKPNRLKINLKADKKYISTDELSWFSLSANWLTGATASSLKTDGTLSLSSITNPFPEFKDYKFSSSNRTFNVSNIDLWDGKLGEDGTARVKVKLPKYSDATGLLKGNILVRVYEPGGERSVHTEGITVSPFTSYVGYNIVNKSDSWYYETDVPHLVDIINVDAEGKPKANNELTYKVYKLSWSWWYDRSDSGSNYVDNLGSQTLISSGNMTTDAKGRAFFNVEVKYPNYGYYLFVVQDSTSKHTVYSNMFIDWPYWRGTSDKSSGKGLMTFDFKTDKDSYEVGEDVVVTLPPLKNGRAFVSIENGTRVLSREWVETKENEATKMVFKAAKEFAPNVYLNISLYQPHEQTVNDSPIRLYGVAPIMVTDKATKLMPKVTVPEVLEPAKEFTVSVTETTGRDMTYTLAIVDDGLLDLTSFRTPNPWNTFFAKQALGVNTWDMYDEVVNAMSRAFDKIYRVGGDENMKPADNKANRFKPIVKFMGPFTLKAGKTDNHKVTLPMYVGSVRTMVVASGQGAYGAAEASSYVRSPLMLVSSLPRVLSIGEDVWVPVNLFALEESVKNVELKIETSSNVQVLSASKENIRFDKMGDTLKYFHLKVGHNVGVEKITFTAKSGKFSATETIEIDVRNPNPLFYNIQDKLLEKGEEVTFNYAYDFMNNDQRLNLIASTLPSFDLSKRLNFLSGYQHGCTEQITSRALPLLYIPLLQDVSVENKAKMDATITRTISELYARQTYEGGFMYWPGSNYNSEWATQYAGMFLLRAKELGYQVNDNVLNKFTSYLARTVQSAATLNNRGEYLQAYSLYVLALAGKPNMSAMNRLNESKNLAGSTQWILASAYALAGKDKVANELVYKASRNANDGEYSYYYGSSIRTIAFRLQTLALLNKNSEAFKEAVLLIDNMKAETYYQTQSTAYALMSLGQYVKGTAQQDVKFSYVHNGKKESVITGKAVSNSDLAIRDSKGNVTVKNESNGTIYLQLIEKKNLLKDVTPAVDNGLSVVTTYRDVNGNSINLSSLSQGQDFYAEVAIFNRTSSRHENIAITQIVPTNCEIYGAEVFSQGKLIKPDYLDIRDDRVLTYFALSSGEKKVIKVKLQAVFAGSFIVPAAAAEVMYTPEVNGKSVASEYSIKLK